MKLEKKVLVNYRVRKTFNNKGVITLPIENKETFDFSDIDINNPIYIKVRFLGLEHNATVTYRDVVRYENYNNENFIEFRCNGLVRKFEEGEIIHMYLIKKGNKRFFEILTEEEKVKKELKHEINYNEEEFPEGKVLFKLHKKRERNSKLIRFAKTEFIKKRGELFCEVCGFNFKLMYGNVGENFIEAHHIKPISELKKGEKTKISDIVMVCSNCHKMLHRKRPWLMKKDLRKLINK